jgi:hypothetical protein
MQTSSMPLQHTRRYEIGPFVWTVTVGTTGTVTASSEDEAWSLFQHYRDQAALDLFHKLPAPPVLLKCNGKLVTSF